MAHAEATDHPLAKKVLIDIANEEREHAGEFGRLLEILTGDEAKWLAEGAAEVDEAAAELAGNVAEEESEGSEAEGNETTIGSLRD
jgi:rubrerythrin